MKSVVVHYAEIALKGRNRPWFVGRLVRNLREATADLESVGAVEPGSEEPAEPAAATSGDESAEEPVDQSAPEPADPRAAKPAGAPAPAPAPVKTPEPPPPRIRWRSCRR